MSAHLGGSSPGTEPAGTLDPSLQTVGNKWLLGQGPRLRPLVQQPQLIRTKVIRIVLNFYSHKKVASDQFLTYFSSAA